MFLGVCVSCVRVFVGGCGAGGLLLGTYVRQYQSPLASPVCWLWGWLQHPWSNLLCFLTPVKLHSEVCLYMCVSALDAKQNFLPLGKLLLQPSLQPPTSPPPPALFHSLQGRRKPGKCLGCGHLGGEGGASESRRIFLFLSFKMEAYDHV